MAFTSTRVTAAMGTDRTVRVSNDVLSSEVGREGILFHDAYGYRSGGGRGETDRDISYLTLRNEDGTIGYIYLNAAVNGLNVSTVRP